MKKGGLQSRVSEMVLTSGKSAAVAVQQLDAVYEDEWFMRSVKESFPNLCSGAVARKRASKKKSV